MPQDFLSNAIYSVTPTILVGLIFWFIMRAIIRADRTERKVHADIEAQERTKAARWSLENRASDSATPAPREPATEVNTPGVSRGV
jgi:flagellar biosynthesis/type III secretory pathway M-ring protein FliF/YscJ